MGYVIMTMSALFVNCNLLDVSLQNDKQLHVDKRMNVWFNKWYACTRQYGCVCTCKPTYFQRNSQKLWTMKVCGYVVSQLLVLVACHINFLSKVVGVEYVPSVWSDHLFCQ